MHPTATDRVPATPAGRGKRTTAGSSESSRLLAFAVGERRQVPLRLDELQVASMLVSRDGGRRE